MFPPSHECNINTKVSYVLYNIFFFHPKQHRWLFSIGIKTHVQSLAISSLESEPTRCPGTQSSLFSGRGHSSGSGQKGHSVCVGYLEHFCGLYSLTWPGRATWTPLTILLRPAFRRTAKTPGSWHQIVALHAPHVNVVMFERLFLSEAPPPGRARAMEVQTELDLRQVPVCFLKT